MGNPRTKHVEFPAHHNTLWWHQMGVMAYHITGNMTVCSTFYAANNERNPKGLTSLALCQGNAPLTVGFPDKGPVMQTAYPVVTSSFIDVDQTAEIWQPGTLYPINLVLFCFVPFWLMSGYLQSSKYKTECQFCKTRVQHNCCNGPKEVC